MRLSRTNATVSKVQTLFNCCILRNADSNGFTGTFEKQNGDYDCAQTFYYTERGSDSRAGKRNNQSARHTRGANCARRAVPAAVGYTI